MHIVNETKKLIHQLIEEERPNSILAIGDIASFRMGFFPWEQEAQNPHKPKSSNLCLVSRFTQDFSSCAKLSDFDVIFQSSEWKKQDCYQILIIADLLEYITQELALQLLDKFLGKAQKQVLLLCPKLGVGTAGATGINNGVQTYHPVVFSKYNFSYLSVGKEHENQTQIYSFYPNKKPQYKEADVRDKLFKNADKPLRIAYILPGQEISGATKQMLMQIKAMGKRGHKVFVYTKSQTAKSALPNWGMVDEDDVCGQYVLKPENDYLEHIRHVDAIILGWMQQANEFVDSEIPVFLWEQGSGPLFGDFGKALASTSDILENFGCCYKPPVKLLAVSSLVQNILSARFGRKSQILYAAVDNNFVLPPKPKNPIGQILLVGNGEKEFKNFNFVIKALIKAKEKGFKFEVQWITPTPAAKYMMPKGLKVEYHVAPQQENLPAIYASADIFICHSLYEGFSFSPLEAMAAGTAVLAVNNGGIESYAVCGQNCVLCQQGDMAKLVEEIGNLLNNLELREKLAENGRRTAGKFSVENMCQNLENIFFAT